LQGLLPAIEELLPGVGQRFCVRHLYNKSKKKRNKEAHELKRDDSQMNRAFHGIVCSRCKLPGHNKSTCKLPCPPQQAPTQSGTSQTAPATQAPATQPAASQPALATQSAATQPAAIQPALATQSAATQQAASQPAFATRPVASQSAASNSQQPPSKKGRKDNLSPHQPSHQTQGTQDRNCHVKEATKLLHQEFGVYDVLM
jgi:hypothetical protein